MRIDQNQDFHQATNIDANEMDAGAIMRFNQHMNLENMRIQALQTMQDQNQKQHAAVVKGDNEVTGEYIKAINESAKSIKFS